MLKRRMVGRLYLRYESLSAIEKRCMRVIHRVFIIMVLLPPLS
jgi:hypothetical protein